MKDISPKVTAATAASALALLICVALGLLGVDLPPAAYAAVTTVCVFAAGYLRNDPARLK